MTLDSAAVKQPLDLFTDEFSENNFKKTAINGKFLTARKLCLGHVYIVRATFLRFN